MSPLEPPPPSWLHEICAYSSQESNASTRWWCLIRHCRRCEIILLRPVYCTNVKYIFVNYLKFQIFWELVSDLITWYLGTLLTTLVVITSGIVWFYVVREMKYARPSTWQCSKENSSRQKLSRSAMGMWFSFGCHYLNDLIWLINLKSVCVCVCACVRSCVRACVQACARACAACVCTLMRACVHECVAHARVYLCEETKPRYWPIFLIWKKCNTFLCFSDAYLFSYLTASRLWCILVRRQPMNGTAWCPICWHEWPISKWWEAENRIKYWSLMSCNTTEPRWHQIETFAVTFANVDTHTQAHHILMSANQMVFIAAIPSTCSGIALLFLSVFSSELRKFRILTNCSNIFVSIQNTKIWTDRKMDRKRFGQFKQW